MCVAGEQKCAFQTYTHMCSRCTNVCVCSKNTCLLSDDHACVWVCVCVYACACSGCTHMCVHVPTGHLYVFQENTCLLSDEHVSAPHADVCVFTCTHMCFQRVHICVVKCAHTCVPTGHVLVFQENTCVLSDERVCVCIGLLRVHTHVCSFVHICVFHVYTLVCSRVHAVCSNWTRVCVSGEYMFVIR